MSQVNQTYGKGKKLIQSQSFNFKLFAKSLSYKCPYQSFSTKYIHVSNLDLKSPAR